MNIVECKTFVGGIQGSGKTYLTSNKLIPTFNKIIIYALHPTDFLNMPLNPNQKVSLVIPKDFKLETLNETAKKVKALAIKGECDLFVLDEADLFLPKSNETIKKNAKEFYDLFINHRHYKKGYPKYDDKNLKGLAMIVISRRPQSIPTELMEQCEFIFLFAIEGDNVMDKFEAIDKRFKPLISLLSKDRHNFIFKRTGEEPKLYSNVKIRELENTDVRGLKEDD
jgi:hypothetical protein